MQLVPIPTSDIQSSSDIDSPATLLHFETSKKKKNPLLKMITQTPSASNQSCVSVCHSVTMDS